MPIKPRRSYECGSARYNANLNEDAVREIRSLAPTTKHAALAAQFGVTEGNIEHVVSRRTWKHV